MYCICIIYVLSHDFIKRFIRGSIQTGRRRVCHGQWIFCGLLIVNLTFYIVSDMEKIRNIGRVNNL